MEDKEYICFSAEEDGDEHSGNEDTPVENSFKENCSPIIISVK